MGLQGSQKWRSSGPLHFCGEGSRGRMRIYLVIVDETPEARKALRFASRRAAKTNGGVHILALIPQEDFLAWGGVQATIEAESKARAEALVASAAGTLFDESGQRPAMSIRQGDAVGNVRQFLTENTEIAALVLGAAESGAPGPLVAHFASSEAGSLPCPVMVIPGSLSNDDIDRLS